MSRKIIRTDSKIAKEIAVRFPGDATSNFSNLSNHEVRNQVARTIRKIEADHRAVSKSTPLFH